MHWLHGVCGLSTHHTLIATLACMLGHKTIVLAASSNDNGLLHPELVDYELPTSLGWTSAGTDHLQHCMRPFGFAAEDVAAGADALAHRQQQIYSHHMRTGKFVLPAARTEAYVYRAAMRHTAQHSSSSRAGDGAFSIPRKRSPYANRVSVAVAVAEAPLLCTPMRSPSSVSSS